MSSGLYILPAFILNLASVLYFYFVTVRTTDPQAQLTLQRRPGESIYQKFDPRSNLINSLRHFAHLSPKF